MLMMRDDPRPARIIPERPETRSAPNDAEVHVSSDTEIGYVAKIRFHSLFCFLVRSMNRWELQKPPREPLEEFGPSQSGRSCSDVAGQFGMFVAGAEIFPFRLKSKIEATKTGRLSVKLWNSDIGMFLLSTVDTSYACCPKHHRQATRRYPMRTTLTGRTIRTTWLPWRSDRA